MGISSGQSAKRLLAQHAVTLLNNGDVIGLGSGTTAREFIYELCKAVKNGSVKPSAIVATSVDSEHTAFECGLGDLLRPIWAVDTIDIAVDGADEVDVNNKALLKGGGAALTREKIVDYVAKRLIIIVDEGKLVDKLGRSRPIPIEVIPAAWRLVANRIINRYGGSATLRTGTGKLGPIITDNNNYIIDWSTNGVEDPAAVEAEIKLIPGVVENGIFARRRDAVILVSDGSRVWEL